MTSPQVHVIGHPLVQHKLTLMRDKTTSTAGFRTLLREIEGVLLELGTEIILLGTGSRQRAGKVQAQTTAGTRDEGTLAVESKIWQAAHGMVSVAVPLMRCLARLQRCTSDGPS